MVNISGFGTSIRIVALQSFPVGLNISSLSDDQDSLIIEEVESVGYQLTYDGGICIYDKAAVVRVSIAVIPNTEDDINLKLLLSARKGGFKWLPIQDVTSMLITYPDGARVAFSNGTIISGPLGDSIEQSGRRKTNRYTFVFASYGGAQSTSQIAKGVVQSILGSI